VELSQLLALELRACLDQRAWKDALRLLLDVPSNSLRSGHYHMAYSLLTHRWSTALRFHQAITLRRPCDMHLSLTGLLVKVRVPQWVLLLLRPSMNVACATAMTVHHPATWLHALRWGGTEHFRGEDVIRLARTIAWQPAVALLTAFLAQPVKATIQAPHVQDTRTHMLSLLLRSVRTWSHSLMVFTRCAALTSRPLPELYPSIARVLSWDSVVPAMHPHLAERRILFCSIRVLDGYLPQPSTSPASVFHTMLPYVTPLDASFFAHYGKGVSVLRKRLSRYVQGLRRVVIVDTSVVFCVKSARRVSSTQLRGLPEDSMVVVPFTVMREVVALCQPLGNTKTSFRTQRKLLRHWRALVTASGWKVVSMAQEIPTRVHAYDVCSSIQEISCTSARALTADEKVLCFAMELLKNAQTTPAEGVGPKVRSVEIATNDAEMRRRCEALGVGVFGK